MLFVVLILVGRGAWGVYQKAEIARSERDITLRSLTELEARTSELRASMARLTSSRGVEEEVRQKYTVARPGEEVVVVVDDSVKKGKNSGAAEEKSFWQRIVSFFVGK